MLERITKIDPAFHKVEAGYGVHCCDLTMILKGPEGAVQFKLMTGWFLLETLEYWKSRGIEAIKNPYPMDLGYHSFVPRYEGHDPITESCEYVDGKQCFYDGSTLTAYPVFEILLREGSEGVWRRLEEYYNQIFGE